MTRYLLSRLRTFLPRLLLLALLLLASQALAQSTAAPDAPAKQGPQIARLIFQHLDFVFFTIAALSVWGLTLIIQGFLRNRRSVFLPESTTNLVREMIAQKRFKELIDFTETDPTFISRALNPALKRAPNFTAMKEAMETAIGEETAEQFRKIEYLNIIGNLGPLLGLLGTVLGMIEAFQAVASSGGQGANVSELSGGISTALTHTLLGLLLAVPCLAAFGILRTVVDRLTVRGSMVAEELLLMMRPPDAKTGQVVPPRTGAMPQPAAPVPPTPPAAPGGGRKPAAPMPTPQ